MRTSFTPKATRLLAAVALAPAIAVAGAPVALSDNGNAMAGLEKSIVFLQTDWSGYIDVPPNADAAGKGYWTDKLTYSVTCTAFFVSKTAQMVTAGHCVDPGEGRKVIIDGYLSDQKANDMTDEAYANWRVEGDTEGSPVGRNVRAVQPNGVDGAIITSPSTVEVVDFKAPDAGDVALLHLPNISKETPALVIARNAPQVGDEVTSIGFPGDIQDITDQSQIARASFKDGTVSSQQVTPSGTVQIEVSSTLAGGMSGGPTVTKNEQVVGVNSNGLTREANFNFITNTPDLRSFLQSHNVVLAEPQAPSKGVPPAVLWGVIGGVILLLAVAGAVIVMMLRRGRAGRTGAAAPGYAMHSQPPGQFAGSAGTPAGMQPGTEVAQPTTSPAEQAGGATMLSAPGPGGEANFCPHCGSPHRHAEPYCSACGKPVA